MVRVEPLGVEAQLEGFSCGLASVDEWFGTKAWSSRHMVRTHVVSTEAGRVGLFALRFVIVEVEGFSNSLKKGSDANGQSIGLLLAQMGVDEAHQRNGHGKTLLREALRIAAEIYRDSPFQLFVVDAENEGLVSFYEAAGLKRIPNTFRLVLPMSSVMKMFGG